MKDQKSDEEPGDFANKSASVPDVKQLPWVAV